MSEERRTKDRAPGGRTGAPRASRPGPRAAHAARAGEGAQAGADKRSERRSGGFSARSGGEARPDRAQNARSTGTRRPAAAGAQDRPRGARPSVAPHAPRTQARPGNRAPRPRTAPAQSGLNARRLALEVLTDVREKGAYASLALGERLRAARLSPEDRRLATGLVYGTLENQLQSTMRWTA